MTDTRKITRRDGAMRVYPLKDGAQITCGHPVALTAAGQLVACGDPADTIAAINDHAQWIGKNQCLIKRRVHGQAQ